MHVTRETILDMIRARADEEAALERAREVLPESFDTDDHLGELEKLGINPADLQTEGAGSFGQAGRADDQALEPDEGAGAEPDEGPGAEPDEEPQPESAPAADRDRS
jgi:hypothetical protein